MASLTTVIKVKHGKTIRRFTADNLETLFPDLNSLKLKIFSLFFFHVETDFTLSYIDEDGDDVSLLNGDDLREVFRQNLNPLMIHVESKNDNLHHVMRKSYHRMDDETIAYFRYLRLNARLDLSLKLYDALLLVIDDITAELRGCHDDHGGCDLNDYEASVDVDVDALTRVDCYVRLADHDDHDDVFDVNYGYPLGYDKFEDKKLYVVKQCCDSKLNEGGDIVLGFESHSDRDEQESERLLVVKINSSSAADLEDESPSKTNCKAVNSGGGNANDTSSDIGSSSDTCKVSLPAKGTLFSNIESDNGRDNDDDNDDGNGDSNTTVVSHDDNELNIVSDNDDDLVDTNGSYDSYDDDDNEDCSQVSCNGDEETALTKLYEMGFTENSFTKEILKVHRYNIEDSMDDLCGDSDWDLMIDDLLGMETEVQRK